MMRMPTFSLGKRVICWALLFVKKFKEWLVRVPIHPPGAPEKFQYTPDQTKLVSLSLYR